jgi:hypothetical protein
LKDGSVICLMVLHNVALHVCETGHPAFSA